MCIHAYLHHARARTLTQGAEIVRLYQTLLGKEGFRKGMDLYFQRHDGQVRARACVCVSVLCARWH